MSIEPIYKSLGSTIRALRKDRSMTQEQLADALNMLRSSLTQIESGNRRLQIHELLMLSRIFRMPLTILLPNDIKDEQSSIEWNEVIEDKEWREYAK